VTSDSSDFQFGKLIRLVAGIAVIVLLVQFAMDGGPAELARQLGAIRWHGWLLLCGISLIGLAALARIFQTTLRIFKVQMSFLTATSYSAMNTFFNTILPMKGGLWVRGLYMKQRFGVTWGSYLFIMATGQLIQLTMLGAIAVGFYLSGRIPLETPLVPGKSILVVGVFAAVLILAGAILQRERVIAFANKVLRGLKLWIEDPLLFARYLVEILALHGLAAFRLWLAFHYVGTALSTTEICVLYAALAAGLSWTITPGNLGVKEAAIVLLAVILGIDAETALAASIADRLASLSITIVIGGFSAYRVSSSTAAR
jgi:uncharacterized membrane protein YbhN (UPF0104 family)